MLHQNRTHLARLRRRLLRAHVVLQTLAATHRLQTTCWITCNAGEQVRHRVGAQGCLEPAHLIAHRLRVTLVKIHSPKITVPGSRFYYASRGSSLGRRIHVHYSKTLPDEKKKFSELWGFRSFHLKALLLTRNAYTAMLADSQPPGFLPLPRTPLLDSPTNHSKGLRFLSSIINFMLYS